MTRPTWKLQFTRAINPKTGQPGTRYNRTLQEGPGDYVPLCGTLKKTGEPIVYVNRPKEKRGAVPNERKPEWAVFLPGGEQVSGMFLLGPEHPGLAFGDAGGGKPGPDALLMRWELEKGLLTIFVFPDLGPEAEMLALVWADGPSGGISEELAPLSPILWPEAEAAPGSLNNNVHLHTDFET